MKATQIIGLMVLALGIVLLILGINSSQSLGEELRSEFAGNYSDRTVWYIAGGVACILGGGGVALFGLSRFRSGSGKE